MKDTHNLQRCTCIAAWEQRIPGLCQDDLSGLMLNIGRPLVTAPAVARDGRIIRWVTGDTSAFAEDSVEIALEFFKACGAFLQDVNKAGFDR